MVLLYSGIFRQVGPVRLFRGIAAAVIGRGALSGGLATATLGLAIHAAVAYTWTGVYALAYGTLPALRRATRSTAGALAASGLYGVAVCTVMQAFVMPLTRARPLPLASWPFALQAALHVFTVGLPIAFVVRGVDAPAKARPTSRPRPSQSS